MLGAMQYTGGIDDIEAAAQLVREVLRSDSRYYRFGLNKSDAGAYSILTVGEMYRNSLRRRCLRQLSIDQRPLTYSDSKTGKDLAKKVTLDFVLNALVGDLEGAVEALKILEALKMEGLQYFVQWLNLTLRFNHTETSVPDGWKGAALSGISYAQVYANCIANGKSLTCGLTVDERVDFQYRFFSDHPEFTGTYNELFVEYSLDGDVQGINELMRGGADHEDIEEICLLLDEEFSRIDQYSIVRSIMRYVTFEYFALTSPFSIFEALLSVLRGEAKLNSSPDDKPKHQVRRFVHNSLSVRQMFRILEDLDRKLQNEGELIAVPRSLIHEEASLRKIILEHLQCACNLIQDLLKQAEVLCEKAIEMSEDQ